MPDSTDATLTFRWRPIKCPRCGNYCAPDSTVCEKCGGTLALQLTGQPISTLPIDRVPRGILTVKQGQIEFLADYQVVLQLLPSGACLQYALQKPAILGRAGGDPVDNLVDLQVFHANQHGISRRHCSLCRLENRLIVTDLNSTNGTYLNDRRLAPQEIYTVAHGDKLILGTLHMSVFFSSIKGEESGPVTPP